MKIKWYGTASLLLESGGTRLLIDPYLKEFNKKLPRVPLEEARSADAIFITHPHLDHFMDIDAFTEEGGVPRVYVPEIGIEIGKKMGHLTDCMVPMSANERFEIGPFTVKTYQSRHCVFDAKTVLGVIFSPRTYLHIVKSVKLLLGMKHYKITVNDIYALEISDGERTVFVLGSAGLLDGADYPKNADLLVFPYQGRTDMHVQLEKFLKLLTPKGVFLDHFDNAFPPVTHTVNTEKFDPTLKKCLPEARAIVPEEGVWYEV